MKTTKRTSSLIKGGLQATLEASRAVDELQEIKLRHGGDSNFCYRDNVQENWDELVDQKALVLK